MNQILENGNTPYLAEEIIINILKRLPVKSLIRFQCVCKQWKNLIKSPIFIPEHLHHSTHQNPSLLIQQVWRNHLRLSLLDCHMQFRELENAPLISSLACVRVVGSSNGLLCLADYRTYPHSPLLWNPVTKELRQLPITVARFGGMCLFGFGFSPIINDYKIVRIHKNYRVVKVEVYSLSTGLWKDTEFENLDGVYLNLMCNAVTANGVMFWLGFKYNLPEVEMGKEITYVIVSFDIASEVFTVIPWPTSVTCSGKLAVYENKLATLSYSRIENSQYSCLYLGVMEEWGRWSLSEKYIHSPYRFDLYPGTIWRDQIVCLVSGVPGLDTEAEIMRNAGSKVGLYLFSLTTNECKSFAIPGPCFPDDLFNNVESLVPPR